jgi:hypothetical protein
MQVMMKYGGAKDLEDAGRVYNLFAKSRMFEAIPYVLKGSVEGVIERQRGATLLERFRFQQVRG